MEKYKSFEKSDLQEIHNICGKKINSFFKQLDFFILNFGEEIEYCLHTYTSIRVVKGDKILMTAADEYFYPNYDKIPKKVYKKDEMHEKSLLKINLKEVLDVLKDAVVAKVEISETADIRIVFNNGVEIQLFVDFLGKDDELYRFFKYHGDDHYIIKVYNGNILTEHSFCE